TGQAGRAAELLLRAAVERDRLLLRGVLPAGPGDRLSAFAGDPLFFLVLLPADKSRADRLLRVGMERGWGTTPAVPRTAGGRRLAGVGAGGALDGAAAVGSCPAARVLQRQG